MGKKNKACFVKEKGKIYFKDRNGAMWSEECVAGVFEMIHKFNDFLESVQYYKSERVDEKDFYSKEEDQYSLFLFNNFISDAIPIGNPIPAIIISARIKFPNQLIF